LRELASRTLFASDAPFKDDNDGGEEEEEGEALVVISSADRFWPPPRMVVEKACRKRAHARQSHACWGALERGGPFYMSVINLGRVGLGNSESASE